MESLPRGIKMAFAAGISFCVGLLVFYVPERRYLAVPEVWLPVATDSRESKLSLPVKTFPGWQPGTRFLPHSPGDPEIVEVDAVKYGYKASACPNVYNASEQEPSLCKKIGKVDGIPVYGVHRQQSSRNVQAYMMRGRTLIAVTGIHSEIGVKKYLDSFVKVARRDVNRQLAANRTRVAEVVKTIQDEKQTATAEQKDAYMFLTFTPVLPTTLPAGWVQYATRIGGNSPSEPAYVQVFFKKGRDRLINMTLLPKSQTSLGAACGPTPGAEDAFLACSQAKDEDYYTGGTNEPGQVSFYIYRQVGDVVAILQTSAYSENGQQLLFSDQILQTQRSIAKSLRPVDRGRFKNAVFIGSGYDPYSYIRP